MLRRSVLVVFLAAVASACAPSVDLRIPDADGSLQPGRLVVIPVRTEGDVVSVSDGLYEGAEFDGAGAHDDAFWSLLMANLTRELGWNDVRLHTATPDTGFVEKRAMIQGGIGRYKVGWAVRTVSVPTSVDYAALDADHVVFLSEPSLESGTKSFGQHGIKKVLRSEVDAIWMTASREMPVVLQTVYGEGDARGGFARERINRDSWTAAVEDLARSLADEATGH